MTLSHGGLYGGVNEVYDVFDEGDVDGFFFKEHESGLVFVVHNEAEESAVRYGEFIDCFKKVCASCFKSFCAGA